MKHTVSEDSRRLPVLSTDPAQKNIEVLEKELNKEGKKATYPSLDVAGRQEQLLTAAAVNPDFETPERALAKRYIHLHLLTSLREGGFATWETFQNRNVSRVVQPEIPPGECELIFFAPTHSRVEQAEV